jgi:hypothetical protein
LILLSLWGFAKLKYSVVFDRPSLSFRRDFQENNLDQLFSIINNVRENSFQLSLLVPGVKVWISNLLEKRFIGFLVVLVIKRK